jgi:uncharacterized protein involved in exopolysaccharide biosynthesis
MNTVVFTAKAFMLAVSAVLVIASGVGLALLLLNIK